MSDIPTKFPFGVCAPLAGALFVVYVIGWVWFKYERPLYVFGAVALLLLVVGILWWSYRSGHAEFDQLIATPSFQGRLSDVVAQTQPAWKVVFVDEQGIGQTLYLNWTTRIGLRRGVAEPTQVSWLMGHREPIGDNLAHDYPVEVWPMEASRCLVKGDEAYFICTVISRTHHHGDTTSA